MSKHEVECPVCGRETTYDIEFYDEPSNSYTLGTIEPNLCPGCETDVSALKAKDPLPYVKTLWGATNSDIEHRSETWDVYDLGEDCKTIAVKVDEDLYVAFNIL